MTRPAHPETASSYFEKITLSDKCLLLLDKLAGIH
jgi:hypothetical protein